MEKVFTIGHSTRSMVDFISILKSFSIQHLVDIRHYPGSRSFPHFNKEALLESLSDTGINYTHLVQLGGRRKPNPGSVNTAWRVQAFKGYADHMASDEFKESIRQLELIAINETTVYMCSEALWWSCHRALVSDYLKVKGWEVIHIMGLSKSVDHPFTKAATVTNNELSYAK